MIGRKKQIVLKKGSKLHRYIEPPQIYIDPKKEMKGKKTPAHFVSVLGALLAVNSSPKFEESHTKELNGLEGVDWFDLLRERPNNGICMIFFLVEAVSSPNRTSKFLDVAASFRDRRGWLEELPLPPKKVVRSEVFVRRRQAGERSDTVSPGKQVEGKNERWATRPSMKATAIEETIKPQEGSRRRL